MPAIHDRLDEQGQNIKDLNGSVLALQAEVKVGFAGIRDMVAKHHSRQLEMGAMLALRIDTNDANDAARDKATVAFNAHAKEARAEAKAAHDEVVALGAQTGVMVVETADARAIADTVTTELLVVKSSVKSMEQADRGWARVGKVIEKNWKSGVAVIVASVITYIVKHITG